MVELDPAERQGEVWNLILEGSRISWDKLEYCLKLDGKETADPWARAIHGWESWGDPENLVRPLRCGFSQPEFDWEGDRLPRIPYEDCVIYRAHVRGFTKHTSSRVRDKGTFKAVAEKIPYMKELGVTTLELMPVTEFCEIQAQGSEEGGPYGKVRPTGRLNYWGYGDSYLFAPKASYSVRGREPQRELKELVRALHKNGMELVLEFYFSGKEDPAMVLETLRYWVREYHLDGIRLTGYGPLELVEQDPYLSRTKLWSESWPDAKERGVRHLAEYNDGFQNDMRRFLKGDEDQLKALVYRTRQASPEQGLINYMANTNGFTMMDMVSYDQKHNEANGEDGRDGTDYNYSWNCGAEGPTRKKRVAEMRKRQLRNAFLLLFLSQGTPLLLAGDEFGNSKGGNNNAYCQDNDVSWLNWNQARSNEELLSFVKKAIAFRKAHPILCGKVPFKGADHKACGYPDLSYHGVKAWYPEFENFRRQLGILYCGLYGKKTDKMPEDFIFVLYNMHWDSHEFGLPNLPKNYRWHIAVDTDQAERNGFYEFGKEPVLEDQKKFTVEGRAIAVLLGKALPGENVEKAAKKVKKKEIRDREAL